MPTFFDVATGDLRACGAVVTADTETGRATAIERVMISVPESAPKAASSSAGPAAPEAPEPPEPPESGDSLECP